MRYRKLSPTGDYVFGHGSADFFINVPEAPAQAVETRLALLKGEWYLDTTDGTPYSTEILGYGTSRLRDQAIKSRIERTPNVTGISKYSSELVDRAFSVQAEVDTAFGSAPVSTTI